MRPHSLAPGPALLITTLCCRCAVNFGFGVGSPSTRAATDADSISSCSVGRRLPLWVLPGHPRLGGTPVHPQLPRVCPSPGLPQRVLRDSLRVDPPPLPPGPCCHPEISWEVLGRHPNFPRRRALGILPRENPGPQAERYRLDVRGKRGCFSPQPEASPLRDCQRPGGPEKPGRLA